MAKATDKINLLANGLNLNIAVDRERDKILIKANEPDIEILKQIKEIATPESERNFDSNEVTYLVLSDAIESFIINSSFEFGTAYNYDCMSEAEIFVDVGYDEDTDEQIIYKIYVYDKSYIKSIQQELIDFGECVFDLWYNKDNEDK